MTSRSARSPVTAVVLGHGPSYSNYDKLLIGCLSSLVCDGFVAIE